MGGGTNGAAPKTMGAGAHGGLAAQRGWAPPTLGDQSNSMNRVGIATPSTTQAPQQPAISRGTQAASRPAANSIPAAAGSGGGGGTDRNRAIENLRRAIIGQESAGNFRAVNPHSGALGYGQVMPANLRGDRRGWDYDALGRDVTEQEFLDSPDIQLQIINHRLGRSLDDSIGEAGGLNNEALRRTASEWYSGRRDLYNNTRRQSTSGHEYPTIDHYTNSILNRYIQESRRGAS